MGYFSNLAADYFANEQDRDHSYSLPEKQLQWRLEDLQARLEELTELGTREADRVSLPENVLRYVLPRALKTVAEVEAAIDLAVRELAQRYGIYVREAPEVPILDEITDMQITILDMLASRAA